MYKHLFFDLDHTLWDFETNATESLLDMYALLNLKNKGIDDANHFLKNYLIRNEQWWQQYHRGEVSASDLKWKRMHATLLDYNIEDENLAKRMSELFLEILPQKKAVFAYTFEILDYLKAKNYRLHLITNGFENVQHGKLNASGLNTYFEKMITSEGSGFVKPHKGIFDYALNATNAKLEESIMLGDNIEADIIGAHNAGWHTVFVNHINAVAPKEATYTVVHLKELEEIL